MQEILKACQYQSRCEITFNEYQKTSVLLNKFAFLYRNLGVSAHMHTLRVCVWVCLLQYSVDEPMNKSRGKSLVLNQTFTRISFIFFGEKKVLTYGKIRSTLSNL